MNLPELGSEFWSVPQSENAAALPDGNTQFVLSGRTALELVARDLIAEREIRSVCLPAYCCDSMLFPFQSAGMELKFYDVLPSADGVHRVLPEEHGCDAVLLLDYFGFSQPETAELARREHDRGTAVILDRVQSLYGAGLNVRDWLYVEDHCKAIDLVIHNGRVGEVYNIGGHNEMRNIDIVKLICHELGKPESLITHVEDRKGHDMRYAIDPTKIHRELGWLPETKFADGIQQTIQWYLSHEEWWQTIISGEYQNYYEKMYGSREILG